MYTSSLSMLGHSLANCAAGEFGRPWRLVLGSPLGLVLGSD